ncbi:MAG: histidine kinase [Myxococcaceae bacterium]|nr:histidine kinase [Myxococcaceae bacterium]
MNRADATLEELLALRARVAALEDELRDRDAFIIAAAHELRNPISPLMLHVQRLAGIARKAQDGTVPASWLTDQLDVLTGRLTRFLSALNRILDLSSIQSGRIHLVVEQVDLAEVTRDVASGFERELSASGSELTLESDVVTTGLWDRMRLEQVVSNLISNAIRYGNSQPIRVTVRNLGATAELLVADRGLGVAEADQERIFERFERAHRQYRSGFGVGLWMVRQLCEAMNGSVTIESRAGEGSTFRVTLPTNRDGSGDDR